MNPGKPTFARLEHFHVHSASLLLVLLLCADLAFIVLHSVNVLSPLLNNPLLSLQKDNGYPEFFQYIKWSWIIALLTYVSITRRSLNFSAWGVFFTYLLFDDALAIHEKVGERIARNLTMIPPLGLRLQDIGELAVTGVAGAFLLSFVLVSYRYGPKTFRKMSHDLFPLIFALAFFGVFVDMLHISIQPGWKTNQVLTVIEDGGEMIIASIICWYIFLLSVRDENVTTYLFDFIHSVLARRSPAAVPLRSIAAGELRRFPE